MEFGDPLCLGEPRPYGGTGMQSLCGPRASRAAPGEPRAAWTCRERGGCAGPGHRAQGRPLPRPLPGPEERRGARPPGGVGPACDGPGAAAPASFLRCPLPGSAPTRRRGSHLLRPPEGHPFGGTSPPSASADCALTVLCLLHGGLIPEGLTRKPGERESRPEAPRLTPGPPSRQLGG